MNNKRAPIWQLHNAGQSCVGVNSSYDWELECEYTVFERSGKAAGRFLHSGMQSEVLSELVLAA